MAAIIGSILSLVANVMHPRPSDITRADVHLREVAEHQGWYLDHLLLIVSSIVIICGLIFIYRSMYPTPGEGWARMANVMAIISTAVVIIFLAVDGFSLKAAAEAWVNAPPSEMPAAFQAARAVDQLDSGMFFTWILTFFVAVPILSGLAVARSGIYPASLGWVAVVLGIVPFYPVSNMFLHGPNNTAVSISITCFLIFSLWVLIMGILLWRKADVLV